MSDSTLELPVRGEPPPSGGRTLLRKLGQIDEIGVIGALALLIVLLAALVPETFLTTQNFINVSRQASYVTSMSGNSTSPPTVSTSAWSISRAAISRRWSWRSGLRPVPRS